MKNVNAETFFAAINYDEGWKERGFSQNHEIARGKLLIIYDREVGKKAPERVTFDLGNRTYHANFDINIDMHFQIERTLKQIGFI